MFVVLLQFLLKILNEQTVRVCFLTVFNSLKLKLKLLHTLLQHLVLTFERCNCINLPLLYSQLFLLLLDDLAHVAQVIGAAYKSHLFKTEACNLEVCLVITISLGQVIDLLKEDV